LVGLTQHLSADHRSGATLNDIFQADRDYIQSYVEDICKEHNTYFKAAAQALGISPEEAKQIFVDKFVEQLESFPIFNLSKSVLDQMLNVANTGLASTILRSMKGDDGSIPLTLESVNAKLAELGF